MVDSRAKGARGEYLVRDLLREHTNLQFERVPMSGALEYLKGDLYDPNEKSQAKGGNQEPLLFFKYNRSPIFVVTEIVPKESEYMYISKLTCFVCLAEEWLDKEEVKFINGI